MHPRVRRITLGIGTAALLAAPLSLSGDAAAAEDGVSDVQGRVVDAHGKPVPAASVHAARSDRYTLTDGAGRFELTDVPDWSASIVAAKEGFAFASVVRDDQANVTLRLSRQAKQSRAEYPRPDADRRPFTENAWQNLNGTWSFDFDPEGKGENERWFDADHQLGKAIRLPFPYQSLAAFGEEDYATDDLYRGAFADYVGAVWYKRTFTIPTSFAGSDTRLRIGATNWGAAVWLNGKLVKPLDETGDTELVVDLGTLAPRSTHTLAVKVVSTNVDDQSSPIPMGRRDRFTNSGGIWQSVWIEPVKAETLAIPRVSPQITFTETKRTPDKAEAVVEVEATGGTAAVVTLRDPKGRTVGTKTTQLVGGIGQVTLPIARPELWDIERPNLYTADVVLLRGTERLDGVRVTFGLRKIERKAAPGSDGSYQYLWLNNRPIYLRGVLDQGFNPWGIATPTGQVTGADFTTGTESDPGRGSILYDLKAAQRQGLNLVRAHVKVFEPAYYHWADKLGLLIWFEMPSPGRASFNDRAKTLFESLLRSSLDHHRNHPSIVLWALYNEGWGVALGPNPLQPQTIPFIKDMAGVVRNEFSNVLVVDNSACCENGHTSATDINDIHAGLVGFTGLKPFLDEFSALLKPGSKRNFDEGEQAGQPWLMSEMAFNSGQQIDNIALMRSNPKIAGYIGVQLADQEDETVSPFTYDRQARGPQFLDHNGRERDIDLVHGDDHLSLGRASAATVQPGEKLHLPLTFSHFSDLDLRDATLRWKVAGIDRESGRWVDPGIGGSRALSSTRYAVTDAGEVEVPVPRNLRVGYVWTWVQVGSRTVAETFLTFDTPAETGAFDPRQPTRSEWSGGTKVKGTTQTGFGKGAFEYAAQVPAGARNGGTLVFEASSAEAPTLIDPIHATGTRKHPTTLTVTVDGKRLEQVVLPDDPWYPLGIAMRSHTGAGGGGEYGHRVAVPLPKSLVAGKEKVTVRLTSSGGGLRLFTGGSGMEGAPPRIVPGRVASTVPRPTANADDRPGVALAPAVLDDTNGGIAVVSVTNDTRRTVENVSTRLVGPAGWTATPIGSADAGRLRPTEFAHVAFRIQAPSNVVPGTVANFTATAVWTDHFGRRAVQIPTVQEVKFDPSLFPVVGVDDAFDTDSSESYDTYLPTSHEILPELTFGDGLLRANALPAYFTMVTHKTAGPSSPRALVMIQPDHFVGQSPVMDGFFLGLVKDSKNYITAWTGQNGVGGIDVVVDGKLHGYCCAGGPAITKGSKWAIAFDGNSITTWSNPGTGWTRVLTTSTLGAVDLTAPGMIQQYRYAVGFRGQNGEQAIQHLTGRSFPAE
ncbi:sugar-binding domain-containing protein [Kribbella swartbergensis]